MTKIAKSLAVMAHKLKAHSSLDHDDVNALLALPHTVKNCKSLTTLTNSRESFENCFVLLSGAAIRYKTTVDGARQIVAVYVPGDVLNLDRIHLNFADDDIQTMTRANVAIITRDAFNELSRTRSTVARAFFANTLIDASISREWLLNIGRRDARSRIAHFLCELSVRFAIPGSGQGQAYVLPFSQEQLADVLGITAVHVNRMMRTLEDENLIRRDGREITFPRWEALCTASGFSSRYLLMRG